MLREFFTLHNGIRIPRIGLGTWEVKGKVCKEVTMAALNLGYTHIDTAIYYENHDAVGEGISSFPRSSFFLTSKIPPNMQGYETATKATLDTLAALKTDYLDLMLIHWPGVSKPGIANNSSEIVNIRHETWRALEDLYSQGKLKSIGVSNFLEIHLNKLFEVCRIKPHVNQFEYHP